MTYKWQQSERRHYDYLKERYGEVDGCSFDMCGSSNSNLSDVRVNTPQKSFFIEIKEARAQSGQFVVIESNDKFSYSDKNKTDENDLSRSIIDHVNNNFTKYKDSGTKGEDIGIDGDVYYKWIVGNYKNKDIKYIQTTGEISTIVFPVDKLDDYFDIKATVRVKASGSSRPAKGNHASLSKTLSTMDGVIDVQISNGQLFVRGDESLSKKKFENKDQNYYLSPTSDTDTYRVRMLANTRHKTVVFSIKLKQEQQAEDLEQFEEDIGLNK